jgi:predicted ATPase
MTPDQVSKPAMLDQLRSMLNDVFKLRREGAAYARLARQHGYVDGYMRVLLESGIATRSELLEVVAAERVRADGPATGALESEVAA